MSASGVVSIAFAKTGFVLLCTIPSEMLPPGDNDLIKMLKYDLAHLASQSRRAVAFRILDDIETVRVQPILALCISLHRMHVHRFAILLYRAWGSRRSYPFARVRYRASSMAGIRSLMKTSSKVPTEPVVKASTLSRH